MAGSPLIPDIAPVRPEKVPSRGAARVSDGPERPFQDVQKDLAKAGRPKPESPEPERGDAPVPAAGGQQTAQKPAKAEKTQAQTDAVAPAPDALGKSPDASDPVPPATPVAAAPDPLLEQALLPDEDAFALAAPVPELTGRGNSLPFPVSKTLSTGAPATPAPLMEGAPAGPLNLQKMFLQMATGNGGNAESTGAGEVDLEAFKSALADTLESRGSRSSEAPAPTMMTSQRGLEIREGSAIIRQYSTTVDTPVQQSDWGDKMAGKISWLASQNISFAEIHLNPADLGPIDVRVSVQNDQASVAVHSQHASVRDLLELNGHRLRDMMQDNGLNLTKMDVSDQPSRQQQQASGGETGQGSRGSENGAEGSADNTSAAGLVSLDGEAVSTGSLNLQWRSQVDTYA